MQNALIKNTLPKLLVYRASRGWSHREWVNANKKTNLRDTNKQNELKTKNKHLIYQTKYAK